MNALQTCSFRKLALVVFCFVQGTQAFNNLAPFLGRSIGRKCTLSVCQGNMLAKQPAPHFTPTLCRGGSLSSRSHHRTALAASTATEGTLLPSYSKLAKFSVGKKEVNPVIGLLFLIGAFLWAVVLLPAVIGAYFWSMTFDKLRRRAVDFMVGLWAKGAMVSLLYWPKLTGKDNLPPNQEAVMYIPNHCSYLDIFTLSGIIPRKFKYVSKQEILQIPIIGWAMQMAGHIGIKRMDKRSQLQTFKDTVQAMQNGNSIVTFAEGTRSPDGRLRAFKKGPVKMAIKAGVRIVPVSICNLYRWMPNSAATPLAFPRDVEVKIHPPIDPAGKSEEEVLEYVYKCVDQGLPPYQKALPDP